MPNAYRVRTRLQLCCCPIKAPSLTPAHSRRLPQEPRIKRLVTRRRIQSGNAYTRRRKDGFPYPPGPRPRRFSATSAHSAHPYIAENTRIRLPGQMARLPRYHHTTAECWEHRVRLRWCAVPAGHMQNLQIQVGGEPCGFRQDCRNDFPTTAQHWQLACRRVEPGSRRNITDSTQGVQARHLRKESPENKE